MTMKALGFIAAFLCSACANSPKIPGAQVTSKDTVVFSTPICVGRVIRAETTALVALDGRDLVAGTLEAPAVYRSQADCTEPTFDVVRVGQILLTGPVK